MKCRICGYQDADRVGRLMPYLDYAVSVYGCGNCGSRFVSRKPDAYERLHSDAASTYGKHHSAASDAKSVLENKAAGDFRQNLLETPKYKYVIEAIEGEDNIERILEMGCSTGVLGAYFVSRGYKYVGVDVSRTAVEMAKSSFGPHYYVPEELPSPDDRQYDAIYFVGTIGCVDDPLEFIRQALVKLRPGGMLLFNAPNVEACEKFDDIWLSGTMPPDLVNLFDRKIWERYFGGSAEVITMIETERPEKVFKKIVRKMVTGSSVPKAKVNLYTAVRAGGENEHKERSTDAVRLRYARGLLSGIYHRLLDTILALPLGNRYPSEFGEYIVMRKK